MKNKIAYQNLLSVEYALGARGFFLQRTPLLVEFAEKLGELGIALDYRISTQGIEASSSRRFIIEALTSRAWALNDYDGLPALIDAFVCDGYPIAFFESLEKKGIDIRFRYSKDSQSAVKLIPFPLPGIQSPTEDEDEDEDGCEGLPCPCNSCRELRTINQSLANIDRNFTATIFTIASRKEDK